MAQLQCITKHCQSFPVHHTVNPMLCDPNSVICDTPLKTQLPHSPLDAQTEDCLINNWSMHRQSVLSDQALVRSTRDYQVLMRTEEDLTHV